MTMQTNGAATAKRRTVDYSKKYWWLGAMVIPLLVAIIAKLPFGSDSPVSGTTYITSMTLIENQYQEIKGQPLNDPELKEKIQRAIDLGKKHYFDEAAKLFQEVAQRAPVPAIYNDLGVVFQGANQSGQAQDAYNQALKANPQYAPAVTNLQQLTKPVHISVTSHEVEPNDDIFHANRISLNTAISAEIGNPADQDFYVFTTPPKYRDIIEVHLQNQSPHLQSALTFYDGTKTKFDSIPNYTGGGDITKSFAADPNAEFFVQAGSLYQYQDSTGPYILTVRALKAYDSYEPNDDILHASPIALGKTIEAEIMDGKDVDYFQFRASKTGPVTVILDNKSATLQPVLAAFSSDKSRIGGVPNDTAGGNISYSFPCPAETTCYVAISALYGQTAGKYALTIKQE
jgi:tetratricopeptide (TPR) repeat protein